MHPRFLQYLCCPATGEPLELGEARMRPDGTVGAGILRALSGRGYPIIRGIPRFVSQEHYASSFGFEWQRWPRVQFESANVGRPMQGHTTRMWDRITAAPDDQVRGNTIVEFGCGPGRFLDVVRRRGGIAVGIDLSTAVESARKNFAHDPNVLIVQGDLLQPPFRQNAFDGGYSIGVLHHTPSPAAGLAALARTVRPGGWLACCVYPRGDFYDFESVRRFRAAHRFAGRFAGYRFALAYSYLAAYGLAPASNALRQCGLRKLSRYLEENWLVVLRLKDARWRVLDVFDAITPQTASTHTAEEVREWMVAAGCAEVRPTPWCATSAVGARAPVSMQAAA